MCTERPFMPRRKEALSVDDCSNWAIYRDGSVKEVVGIEGLTVLIVAVLSFNK